jgi:hypothetical protein
MVATRESNGRLSQQDVLDAIQVLDHTQIGIEIYLCAPSSFESAMLFNKTNSNCLFP